MDGLHRSFVRFALLSALVLGAVLGLVWAMAIREGAARRLNLEFTAYRTSAALVEAFAENPDYRIPEESSVIGFGLYGPRGAGLLIRGDAPHALAPGSFAIPSFTPGPDGDSYILIRPLGAESGPMRGSGQMMGRMGMMPGEGIAPRPLTGTRQWLAPPAPIPPTASPPPEGYGVQNEPLASGTQTRVVAPRALWLSFDRGDSLRQRRFIFGAALLVSAALLGLYALLLRLYHRNAELRDREGRNRELVQLGEAARTLAHEIKNPLAVIRVQAATLKRAAPPDYAEAASRSVDVIEEEVDRLTMLSDRIREFLKGGEGESRTIELNTFLTDFALRFGPGAIELAAVPREARVRADPARLAQALDNLITNAREADPEGRPRIAVERRGRRWEIGVSDRGPGVAPELEARLFEPFFSTKEKGSGIGLALARRIVEGIGGALDYKRREGGGAVFLLELPAI